VTRVNRATSGGSDLAIRARSTASAKAKRQNATRSELSAIRPFDLSGFFSMRVRRRFFLQLPVVLAAVVMFSGDGRAGTMGANVPPPLAAQPVVDTHWGVAVPDPLSLP
jgi:hypothetical protein